MLSSVCTFTVSSVESVVGTVGVEDVTGVDIVRGAALDTLCSARAEPRLYFRCRTLSGLWPRSAFGLHSAIAPVFQDH